MNNKRIIFVTGGQRSGKSVFAEKLALAMAEKPVYVATATVVDDEFRRRVEVHRQRRGDRWTTFEEPLEVGRLDIAPGSVVLFDCVTLWATNAFFAHGKDSDAALAFLLKQLEGLLTKPASIIFVTNEIGLGGTSPNALQRAFADLQGSINQAIAAKAHEAYMVVSGIPVKIK